MISKEERNKLRQDWVYIRDHGEATLSDSRYVRSSNTVFKTFPALLHELDAAEKRIAELEAEVEKGYMMVKNRENKLRKRMAKIAELRNTGTVARQKDQLREQGQYIEALKAARDDAGKKITDLEHEIDNLHRGRT